MKSMVYDYTPVQREIEAHNALSKTAKITETAGKQHVRRALDHLNLGVTAIIVSSVMSLLALLCNSLSLPFILSRI
jgi:hypothetical protein